MTIYLRMAKYAHAHFNDLDLDARSQWVGREKNQCWIISTTNMHRRYHTREIDVKPDKRKLICIKHAIVYMTSTLKTFMWLDHLVNCYFVCLFVCLFWGILCLCVCLFWGYFVCVFVCFGDVLFFLSHSLVQFSLVQFSSVQGDM